MERQTSNGHRAASPPADAHTVKVNLNTASLVELQQLTGVGPALAERIIRHRRYVRRFTAVQDLMSVPGISAAKYARLAAQAYVDDDKGQAAPPPPEPTVEPASGPPSEAALADSPHPAEHPPLWPEAARLPAPAVEMAVEAAVPAALPEPVPAQSQEPAASVRALPKPEPIDQGRAAPGPQPSPDTGDQRAVAAPAPALARPPARDWTALIALSLLGAFLGSVFTLLILAGLNRGTLVLNEQADILGLRRELGQAETRLGQLEAEGAGLRTRLEALEGLTGRMAEAETALAEMQTALASVEADTAALGERAEALEADLATVRDAAERFDVFLAGLRELLNTGLDVPEAGAAPTERPGPTATPEPGR